MGQPAVVSQKSSRPRVGLVLAGGGARGAYQAGVLNLRGRMIT